MGWIKGPGKTYCESFGNIEERRSSRDNVKWWNCEWTGASGWGFQYWVERSWLFPECDIVKGYARGSSIKSFECRNAAVWFYRGWCLAYAPRTRLGAPPFVSFHLILTQHGSLIPPPHFKYWLPSQSIPQQPCCGCTGTRVRVYQHS